MVRLMILGLICYWLVFLVLNQGLTLLTRRWTVNALDDRPVFWINLGVGLVTLAGLIFVNLVMDYARVNLVREEETSAAMAFLSSLGFSLGRLRKALTVYAIPSLLGIALLVVYRLVVPWNFVNRSLGSAGWSHLREPLVLALLFIGQQVIMLGRYWFRVATWASEWSYFSRTR
jgi:FtsH-binding integral membrane protein